MSPLLMQVGAAARTDAQGAAAVGSLAVASADLTATIPVAGPVVVGSTSS
jgi:hypothetical protein